MVTESTEEVRVRTDDDGVTYFLDHDGRRVRVRFRNNSGLRVSVEGRYTIDEARMSYAYKGSTIGNIDLSPRA
jgi:hypothetical protein